MEIDTLFLTKTAKNHTFWRRTYLCSLYKGVPYASETNEVNLSLTFTQRLGYEVNFSLLLIDCAPQQ